MALFQLADQVMQHKENKKKAYRFVVFQLVLTCVIALCFMVQGIDFAKSALKGGLIAVVANVVFIFLAFRVDAAEQPQFAMNLMQKGLSLKLLISALLFFAVLQGQEVQVMPLALTFVIVTVAQNFKGFFFKH